MTSMFLTISSNGFSSSNFSGFLASAGFLAFFCAEDLKRGALVTIGGAFVTLAARASSSRSARSVGASNRAARRVRSLSIKLVTDDSIQGFPRKSFFDDWNDWDEWDGFIEHGASSMEHCSLELWSGVSSSWLM